MNRLVTNITNSNWVAPAGVTEILICGSSNSGVEVSNPVSIPVVPDTTYNVTINSSSYSLNNPNTFGSSFNWTGSGYLKISWIE